MQYVYVFDKGIKLETDIYFKDTTAKFLAVGMPCIDETGITKKFDLRYAYQMNLKGAFRDAPN